MKAINYQPLIASLLLLSASLFSSLSAFAGGYVELPRSYGSLEMGMSEQSFIKLTGVNPESCVICINKESFATLSRGQLYRADAEGDGADVFFYDNRLYLISVSTVNKDLFTINDDFENELGGPGTKLGTLNDVTKLKWEDTQSVITINYREQDKAVFSVNYYDWEIKQERDWREAQEASEKKAQQAANALAVID